MITPIILLILLLHTTNAVECSDFTIPEATIDDIQAAFKQNKLKSKDLVTFYIHEIRKLNPTYRAIIEVNPDAIHQAESADQDRRNKNPNSCVGLHGIPVLLKDNIATKDKLNTTAGSYALFKSIVPRDVGVVNKLRESGAIILGKASMSEWASFRSLKAPSGWNHRAKQAVNPYGASFGPCGSSTGSAISVAANMVIVSLGTETDGSILCPANANSVVGIKPTLGLTSRAGVVPISPRQDTIGGNQKSIKVYSESLRQGLKEKIKEYPQDMFLAAEKTNGIGKLEKEALMNLTKASKYGFDKLMKDNKLDALVTPYAQGSNVLAIGGYPGISVPAGYDENGGPYGICFGGLKGSEPTLIAIAYGFEQVTHFRKPPPIKNQV